MNGTLLSQDAQLAPPHSPNHTGKYPTGRAILHHLTFYSAKIRASGWSVERGPLPNLPVRATYDVLPYKRFVGIDARQLLPIVCGRSSIRFTIGVALKSSVSETNKRAH